MIQLVIFDMDGVLLSSEPYHDRARNILMKRLGIDIPLRSLAGISNAEIWDPLIKRYGLKLTQPEIELEQKKIAVEMMERDGLPLCEGVLDLLPELKSRKIQMAVASSSLRWYVDHILKHYDIEKYFSYVISGSEVQNKKPDPEIYLKTLEAMNVLPSNALAIEDSDPGQLAATQAGIGCLGYVNPDSGIQKLNRGIGHVQNILELLLFL